MNRKALLSLFLVVFVDLLGFGIVIPILPYYVRSFDAGATELGWLMAIYSLMQFFFAPVWGGISDRWGRRPVLLISIAGAALSLLWLGYASSLWEVFAARLLGGISGANISTAYAYVADVTDAKNRAKGMGLIGASFGLGFVFGPAIGGVLSPMGLEVPMLVGSGLAAFNFFLALFVLKEPKKSKKAREKNRRPSLSLNGLKKLAQYRQAWLGTLLFFLLTLAVTKMEVLFALYMSDQYGLDVKEAGLLLALFGLIMAVVQGGGIGALTKWFGQSLLIPMGFLIAGAALAGFAFPVSFKLTVGALTMMAFGYGILHPSLSSYTSFGAPEARRGEFMGIFHSGSSLARIIGPLMAGVLYDQVGTAAPFLLGSGFLFLGLLCFGAFFKKAS
jgi:MFS family permease